MAKCTHSSFAFALGFFLFSKKENYFVSMYQETLFVSIHIEQYILLYYDQIE